MAYQGKGKKPIDDSLGKRISMNHSAHMSSKSSSSMSSKNQASSSDLNSLPLERKSIRLQQYPTRQPTNFMARYPPAGVSFLSGKSKSYPPAGIPISMASIPTWNSSPAGNSFQFHSEVWISDKHQLLEKLKKQLGHTNIHRYWANSQTNPSTLIYSCFKPLLKRRKTLDKEVDKVLLADKTRGFFKMTGQLVAGAGLFICFLLRNYHNDLKYSILLGVYYFVLLVMGILIGFSLYHLWKELNRLEEMWEQNLKDAELRLLEFKLIYDGEDCIRTLEEHMIEHSIASKLVQISSPLNFGFLGFKLILLENVIPYLLFVTLPIFLAAFLGVKNLKFW